RRKGVQAARASERIPSDEQKHWPGFLGLEFVFVEVADDLVLDRVELVEGLALLAVQQVGADRTDREAVTKALLNEYLEIRAVCGGYFLAHDPAVGATLLTVRRAECRADGGKVLDDAEVVDVLRLVVEAPLPEHVADVAVEQRNVAEHAGVGQPDEAEIGREVELDAIDFALSDIRRRQDKSDYVVLLVSGTGHRIAVGIEQRHHLHQVRDL